VAAATGEAATAEATAAVAATTGEAATTEATAAVAAATGEAATADATAAVAATTGEAATGEAATTEATAAVAAATAAAAATTTTTVATAAATTTTATAASLCNSIGRGEGDANCRNSGKKSDLSGHGTTPRIGIAPCKFNTTHANLFRLRNVSLGSLPFFRRSHDRYDLLHQFSPQASVYARHTGLIEEDAFPEPKPEGPFSVVWRRAP
jgi:hypothetical protein